MQKAIDTVKQQNKAMQNITSKGWRQLFFCWEEGEQVNGWCFLMFKLSTFQRNPMKLRFE